MNPSINKKKHIQFLSVPIRKEITKQISRRPPMWNRHHSATGHRQEKMERNPVKEEEEKH